jgi:hypothetical protein
LQPAKKKKVLQMQHQALLVPQLPHAGVQLKANLNAMQQLTVVSGRRVKVAVVNRSILFSLPSNQMTNNFGLKKNPFSKYSAEEELEQINSLFFKPNYYETLVDDLKNGSSRFILGQRGHGKSTLIHYLKNDLEKNQVFTVILDKFDGIPISNNDKELIELVIKNIIKKLGVYLSKNQIDFKRLTKTEKEKLIIYISLFFHTMSRREFEDLYNKLDKVKVKNFFIRIYNRYFQSKANSVANTAVNITSQMISNSLGYPNVSQIPYHEYFKELKEIEISKVNIRNTDLFAYEKLKAILCDLVSIIKNLEFQSTVILFDKIDEFKLLNQDLNKIVDFTKEILTDTELLLQENVSIAFSLWTEVRYLLNAKGVRFDKFKEIDVSWNKDTLEKILDKRLQYYSEDSTFNISRLIKNTQDKTEVMDLASKSPRDLIRLLSSIYDVQISNNPISTEFERNNIARGCTLFAQNYDYISIHPSKSGSGSEVMPFIKKLLLTRKHEFDIKDMNVALNQKTKNSENHISKMLTLGLIVENEVGKTADIRLYNVINPKLRYLISRNITSLEN